MDMNEQRLAFVREKMGVADTILASGDEADVKTFTDLTGGKLGNVVVDATGSNKSMGQALNYVGFAGRLVFVGITTQEIRLPASAHAPPRNDACWRAATPCRPTSRGSSS